MTTRERLVFEQLSTFERRGSDASPNPLNEGIFRAQVPGGWLILLKADQPTLLFYPDPDHKWDGGSMQGRVQSEQSGDGTTKQEAVNDTK